MSKKMSNKNKFTILHPISDYKNVNTKKGVSQYASALSKRGHDVELIIFENKDIKGEAIDVDEVDLRRVSAEGIWKILSIIPILFRCQSDVFLTQFFGRKDLVWAPICWLKGVKYTIMFDYTPQGSSISTPLYYWIKLKLAYLSIFVHTFFAKTSRSREELCSICTLIGTKTEILPSGVEDKYFIPKSPSHSKTIIYVGRLAEDKKVDILIEAFNNLKARYNEWELEIAGDGPKRYEMVDSDRIIFRGYLQESEVIDLYSKADVFCLPSLHESFSNVLIEAAAAETAIISTNVGVAPDLLEGMRGLIEKNSVDSLEHALEEYMQSPESAKEDGKELGTRAEEFRLSTVVQKLEDVA